MFIKFNVVNFFDPLTGIVFTTKVWVHSENISFIEEYFINNCKIRFFDCGSDAWYCSDSFTGDELIELLNNEEKSNL